MIFSGLKSVSILFHIPKTAVAAVKMMRTDWSIKIVGPPCTPIGSSETMISTQKKNRGLTKFYTNLQIPGSGVCGDLTQPTKIGNSTF
jgi:hypothetical protein